jgi:peroxiredoxin
MTIGLLACALGMVELERPHDLWAADERPEEGHRAPDFSLKTLDGKTVRLFDFRGKKVVLINFWATWCPPCRVEMPSLQKIHADYKKKGFEILAVSVDTDANREIREFMGELRLTFPVLLDPDMKVARRYRVFGLPASILVDRGGMIRLRETGYSDWTLKESRKEVESLLQ